MRRAAAVAIMLPGALGGGIAQSSAADPPPAVHPDPPSASTLTTLQPPGTLLDPRDFLFAAPTQLDHIGRIAAPVMIDGKGPFRFILDTGASHSTISPSLAEALGLEASSGSSILVNGITGTARVPSVLVHKLQAGSLQLENTRLPVVWAPLMAGADGILGVAGIRNASISVDFRRNEVTISRDSGRWDSWGATVIPATRIGDGLLSVAARVGAVRVRAIIDTGSQRTLGNRSLYSALYTRRRADSLPRIATVYGATTAVSSGEMAVAPTIRLGSVRISSVTVVYGDFHIFDVWGLATQPTLIIGMDVLGTVRALGIDLSRSELYLDTGGNHFESLSSVRAPRACEGTPGPRGPRCSA